jgi:hypothetical protein
MIIDNIQQLQSLKERTVFLYPISKDNRLHNYNNSIIGFIVIDTNTKEVFTISNGHPDGIFNTSNLDFLNSCVVYCYNVELLKYSGYCVDNHINVKLQYYLQTNKGYDPEYSSLEQHYSRQYQNCHKINELIPLYKHEELAYEIFTDCYIKEQQQGLTFYQEKIFNVFHNIEKQGIKINESLFEERFGQSFSRNKEHCHTQYNYYTTTGRPSNRFGGINFAALNKEDSTRECFVSEFGTLLEMDFNSYHPRLIASLIGYDFGSDNVYEHLAKYYHNTPNPTSDQILDAKEGTFRQLYGGIQKQYLHIPFFAMTDALAQMLWNDANEHGYITSPLSGRKLVIDNYQDINCYTLFNYFIQMYETETNVLVLEDLFKVLDKDIVPILYTYDSILFDLPKEKIPVLKELLYKVVPKEFPFKLKTGVNYKTLSDM